MKYAVMTPQLDAYSLLDSDLKTCIRHCRGNYVVVEQIPALRGFSVRLLLIKHDKPFSFNVRLRRMNILNVHIFWEKEYLTKPGKIVYKRKENKVYNMNHNN